MPNWCSTKYVAFTDKGDKSDLKRLHSNLAVAIKTPSGVPNGFGEGWLGDIAVKHGLDWESVPCKGTIEYLDEYDDDSNSFTFDTETAWGPCDELWEAIFAQYDGVSFVYIAEEPGNGYFVNTDTEGRFLPEKFLLDVWGDGWNLDELYAKHSINSELFDGCRYFDDFEELAAHCFEVTGRKFASIEEIRNFFDNIFEEELDVFVGIHEFEAA